jgi:hypothetical protein
MKNISFYLTRTFSLILLVITIIPTINLFDKLFTKTSDFVEFFGLIFLTQVFPIFSLLGLSILLWNSKQIEKSSTKNNTQSKSNSNIELIFLLGFLIFGIGFLTLKFLVN